MNSIIQTEKVCFLCGCIHPYGLNRLEEHHVFFGPNRKKSEKLGLKVYLCGDSCHRNGPKAAHRNRETDLYIKRKAQEVYEKTYGTREDFRGEFGKSYL